MHENMPWGSVGTDCSDYHPENYIREKVDLHFVGFVLCVLSSFVVGFIIGAVAGIFK